MRMKVLLTGANGFIGRHILERLRLRQIATAVLVRPASQRRFVEECRPQAELHFGSINEPESVRSALRDATHVIHCAGCTKAVRTAEFYETNEGGTRNLVAAINRQRDQIQRLVCISSLAASRPALPDAPVREDDPPCPVSEYGRSKLAGERVVRETSAVPFVILRPAAVYGPGDADFFKLFQAVRMHVRPCFGGGRQPLSLVFVTDLADAVMACLTHPEAAAKTYNVAASEVVTSGELARQIAREMKVWTVSLSLPLSLLWPLCLAQDLFSRLTGRPDVLSRQKYAELRAPGWVCDSTRIGKEIGLTAPTTLEKGIAETLAWYRQKGWLR